MKKLKNGRVGFYMDTEWSTAELTVKEARDLINILKKVIVEVV